MVLEHISFLIILQHDHSSKRAAIWAAMTKHILLHSMGTQELVEQRYQEEMRSCV